MASLLSRLAPKGHPGQVFVCMLRYGYGNQRHLEKMEILHSWYSHLRAYIPEKRKKEEFEEVLPLLEDANKELLSAWDMYKPQFEGDSCDPDEKNFTLALWGVYERLDEITAKSKIIDDIKAEDGMEV
jgi:hypothetical protein